ncbi:MAG: ATP-binding cassette domain-containing protein [Nitrolancea sp.]
MVSRAPARTATPTAAESSDSTIDVVELVKTYPGDVKALQGLTFNASPGTIFGLLGPNGAGKSTIVKILTTLSRPDSGQARVCGIDVVQHPQQVRRLVGYVSQQSAVDPDATGRENLTLQGRLYGLKSNELKLRIDDLLDGFDLNDAANRLVKTYSGGTKRKLDVTMGLVNQPRVLFLDEPTTGLDPEARADMWREIRRLAVQQGITILLTTHYLEEADQLAGRVAIIDRGNIVVEGTPEQLKQELHGDTIQIELECEPRNDVGDTLRGLGDQIREVSVDGREIRARVGSGATMLPLILSTLDAAGMSIASITVARPSLDDVYLRYAGRTFAAAHEEGIR